MAKSKTRKMSGAAKVLIAVLVVVVLIVGVCCTGYASRGDGGKWFENPNLSTWHWSDKPSDTPNEPDDPDTPDTPQIKDDGGAELENGESNGI